MTTDEIKETIRRNAVELTRLHRRIHETVKHRDEGEKQYGAWSQACDEFHRLYEALACPRDFYNRIRTGEEEAIEIALCFLEVRPYFFRSGYLFKEIARKCNHAPMTEDQAKRFALFLEKYREWKKHRDESAKRGATVRNNLTHLITRFSHLFPINLSDGNFDGLVTVGDMYMLLCKALKVEPSSQPERENGVVREPLKNLFPVGEEYTDAYRAWRTFVWTPEDVWATLVALITDVCKVDPSFAITRDTILRQPTTE